MATRAATFVTVVGRLFIVASAVGLVIAVAQNVVAWRKPGGAELDGGARILLVAFPFLCLATLVVSLAFLKRRPWSRTAMIGLAALGFFGHLFALVVGRPFMPAPAVEGPASFQSLLRIIQAVNIAYPIAACVFFGWLVGRLMSRGVRGEFQPPGAG